jgi:Flp pilus assembly protein TadG
MNAISENLIKLKNQSGQSIIEVALITPLLLIALYIPADFGVAFFVGNLTQTAVREAARVGSGLQKSKSGQNSPFVFDSAQADTVKDEVFSRLPAALTGKSVTVTFYTGTACMEFLEVTAQGNYNYFLYQVIRLFGGTAPNSVMMSRTTQMHYKYQPYTNSAYCTAATSYGPFKK